MQPALVLLHLSALAVATQASFQQKVSSASTEPRGPAIVGAIRWDAYFATPGTPEFEDPNFGIVSRTTTYDMSPKKWHYRLPFFAKELNDTSIVSKSCHRLHLESRTHIYCLLDPRILSLTLRGYRTDCQWQLAGRDGTGARVCPCARHQFLAILQLP